MTNSDVLSTLADLVRINSVNPAYEGGRPEREIAGYIQGFFEDRGIETFEQQVFPERPNLIARLPGRQPGRRLIFEAHTDTASVAGMEIPPFEPVIRDHRLYGRGSCDTKAGLAAMMHALASLKAEGITPPCEIWLAAAADEEYSFRGVLKLREGLEASGAIVAEPTEMRAIIASKGVLRWRLRTQGKAAHSSKPDLGVSAIVHMAHVVLALEADALALKHNAHPLLGPATCNIGVIHGGRQVNFVPDECAIEIDRRLIPGEKIRQVLAHYAGVLEELKKAHPALEAVMEPPILEDEPLETAQGAPVAVLASTILDELGLEAAPAGVPFGSDASKLARHGVPSIIFGPGSIDQAHAAVEYVDCEQVSQAVEFYRQMMLRFE